MPYIIETRTPYPYKAANAVPPGATIDTRTAVATLEEARESAFQTITDSLMENPFDLDALISEAGGTITLPDGTVIEVRQVDWAELNGEHGYRLSSSPAMAERIIAAFNAK